MWSVALRALLMLYVGLIDSAAAGQLPEDPALLAGGDDDMATTEEMANDEGRAAASADEDHQDKNDDEEGLVWFEEEIDSNLKLTFALNGVLHSSTSQYQRVELLDAKHFGKVLAIDGKLQSAESDEFIYHECLVHPSLLLHPNPKRVFIMGGGEGSTAREVLIHGGVEKVVMCDIDSVVVDFCRAHLTLNQQAFAHPNLQCLINDAKVELEGREDKFDVIIGDLADPLDGGPCNKLYTKSFYQSVVKLRLNPNGIFVTQAGPAGVPSSHKLVFTSIYNTLKQVFKFVLPYTTHIPSYTDTWGWIMASDEAFTLDVEEVDKRIGDRVVKGGGLLYMDGASFVSSTVLNKILRASLAEETHVFTEEDGRFIHGHGILAADDVK